VLQVLNFVFTAVFVGEAAVKLIGLSVAGYFFDRWNLFVSARGRHTNKWCASETPPRSKLHNMTALHAHA
jgi:hypothetical protein